MAKAGRNGSQRTRRGAGATKNCRAVDLAAVRQKVINLVGSNACAMVKTTTDEFKKTGNISTLKYLFEMIGLFPCPAGEEANSQDDSLTAALFERLGAPKPNGGESEVTNDSAVQFVRLGGDAVE